MPAILTHDFFGRDAYGPAMDFVDLVTPDQRDAFLLGNQGPDPLFYLVIAPRSWDRYKKLGSTMHHDAPSTLLADLRSAVDAATDIERSTVAAYAAGFVCHYLLDSAMHPLVYFWQNGIEEAGIEGLDARDGSVIHAEIERDFDEMVLWNKMHQTVETYRPYERVLRARDEVLGCLGELYANTDFSVMGGSDARQALVFPEAVRCFRVCQRAFWMPGHVRSLAISGAERHVTHGRYSLYQAMAHRARKAETSAFDNHERLGWRNPFTGRVRSDSFWDIYNEALDRVPQVLEAFFAEGFDESAARQITGGLNFSGEPVE